MDAPNNDNSESSEDQLSENARAHSIRILLPLLGIALIIAFVVLLSTTSGTTDDTSEDHPIKAQDQISAHKKPLLCLKGDQHAEYRIQNNKSEGESFVTVSIVDGVSKSSVDVFTEPILQPGHYHPVETMPCAAYFIRGYKHDPSLMEQREGFEAVLRRVSYDGQGEDVLTIARVTNEEYQSLLSRDFRVSPDESYLAMTQDYRDNPDYGLVIKNIKPINGGPVEDRFTVLLKDVLSEQKNMTGIIGLLEWSPDGQYFWSNIYEGAYTRGWIKINTTDLKYVLYPAPEGILNGYPPNLKTGWVPLVSGAFWTGSNVFDEQIRQSRIQDGITADLYLFNFINGETILVEDTDVPDWQGLDAVWADDSTLEYSLPDGSRKSYTLL